MRTISDIAPMRRAYLTEGSKALGEVYKSLGIEVVYVPSIMSVMPHIGNGDPHVPHATRDIGFFHGNKFYGHFLPVLSHSGRYANWSKGSENALHGERDSGLECALHKAGDGGGIISDGKIAIVTNAYDMHPFGENKKQRLEEELGLEVFEVNTAGVHIDVFLNFVAEGIVICNNKYLIDLFQPSISIESLQAFKDSMTRDGYEKGLQTYNRQKAAYDAVINGFEQFIAMLSAKGYTIFNIDREYIGIHAPSDDFTAKQSRSYGYLSWQTHLSILGNIVPVKEGVIVMAKDIPKEVAERKDWKHIPTELRKMGIEVHEVSTKMNCQQHGEDTGPRCRTLPERVR